MSNYPDGFMHIQDLPWNEPEQNDVHYYHEALYGSDIEVYSSMFDILDSSELTQLLRDFHANPSEWAIAQLVEDLDKMLINHLNIKNDK